MEDSINMTIYKLLLKELALEKLDDEDWKAVDGVDKLTVGHVETTVDGITLKIFPGECVVEAYKMKNDSNEKEFEYYQNWRENAETWIYYGETCVHKVTNSGLMTTADEILGHKTGEEDAALKHLYDVIRKENLKPLMPMIILNLIPGLFDATTKTTHTM